MDSHVTYGHMASIVYISKLHASEIKKGSLIDSMASQHLVGPKPTALARSLQENGLYDPTVFNTAR